jgi:RHS repeat-associated protein
MPDGKLLEYIHDPLYRRIATKVNGAITEKYLWEGQTKLLAIYDGSDNVMMRFDYADGRMPYSMTSGGNTYYLTYDHIGSLRLVTDRNGSIIKKIEYDSFGNIIADTNPQFNVMLGFAGGLQDPDTGLVRFGYRDYNPDTGRWTAKDPILFAGGDTDLYGYVTNNPVNWVDPEGLAWYGKFLGPVDPGDPSPYGNEGINELDESARKHDIAYDKIGAKGPISALFDKDTVLADAQLVGRALMATFNLKSNMDLTDRAMGLGTSISFGAITITKIGAQIIKAAIFGGNIKTAKRTLAAGSCP